jgi:hypothetical protein
MLIYQMGVADVLRSDPTFMARVAQVLVRPLRMGGGGGGGVYECQQAIWARPTDARNCGLCALCHCMVLVSACQTCRAPAAVRV